MIMKEYTDKERKEITDLFREWFGWFLRGKGLTFNTSVGVYEGKEYRISDLYEVFSGSIGMQNRIKPTLESLDSMGMTVTEYLGKLLPKMVECGYITA